MVRTKITLDSVPGSKMLASLIACIRTEDLDFQEWYNISVKDFLQDTGGGSYRQLKAACRALSQATVELEFFTPGDNNTRFIAIPFFSVVDLHHGKVRAKFNNEEKLKDCLLALRAHFTKYNLLEYLRLPSIYSQRIFEILKSWVSTRSEVEISLSDLHNMLNTPDSFRKKFPDFRRNVLEKAHKDINAKTEMPFAWETIKHGRAVVAIRFIFSAKLRAIAEASIKQEKQAKQSAENKKLWKSAMDCAKSKAGLCTNRDNKKKEVCNFCQEYNFCLEVQAYNKRNSK